MSASESQVQAQCDALYAEIGRVCKGHAPHVVANATLGVCICALQCGGLTSAEARSMFDDAICRNMVDEENAALRKRIAELEDAIAEATEAP